HRLRLPRGGEPLHRRHLPQQRGQERPVAGGGRPGHARVPARALGCRGHDRPARADDHLRRRAEARHVPHRSILPPLPAGGGGRAGLPALAGGGHRRLRARPCRGAGMKALIAVLPGDGIGPEVVSEATRVLRAVGERFGHSFELREAPFAGAAIDAAGVPLPADTLALCRAADAVLLGAVGGPRWESKPRPEEGLLALRKELGLYCARRTREPRYAEDVCSYSAEEVERVVRVAGRLARGRKKRLASVDKANVPDPSRLWREVTSRVVRDEFPDVALEHVLVDACAMHLVREPARFDVLVTENLF